MSSILDVGRDLGRAFRERPALIVGGGVLLLVGVNVLNRRPEEASPPADPLAELFPGVSTAGGAGIPGSGSVPFAGYPSAGDGAVSPPPELAPLPPWGLSCNGEPQPSIAGLPGTWKCTEAGWAYVPPASSPAAPGGTSYLFATVAPGTYTTYSIVSGRAKATGSLKTGGFTAEVRKVTATQTDGSGTTTLARIVTGVYAGKHLYYYARGITVTTRTR